MKLYIVALFLAVNAYAPVSNLLDPMVIQISNLDGPAYRLNPLTPQLLH